MHTYVHAYMHKLQLLWVLVFLFIIIMHIFNFNILFSFIIFAIQCAYYIYCIM